MTGKNYRLCTMIERLFNFGGKKRIKIVPWKVGLCALTFWLGCTLPQAMAFDSSLLKEDAKQGPLVRVLLGSRTKPLVIGTETSLMVLTGDKTPWGKGEMKGTLAIKADGKYITINGKRVGESVYLKPMDKAEHLSILGKSYRGYLKVAVSTKGALMLINELPLEEYLYGVVPKEAIPSWPKAALEAQAVAARSYALHNIKASRNPYYDLLPNTNSQEYGGLGAEYGTTNEAVNATRGMVMLYNGQPIEALYHADGGGYTADSENVWGSKVGYLRGVKDYVSEVKSGWTVTLSRSALEKKLKAVGKDVGTLREIILSPLSKRPMHVSDRDVSGRIKTVTLVGDRKSLTLSGTTLQSLLGLRSTLFDFYVNAERREAIDKIKKVKASHNFSSKKDELIYIQGYGWGHGLGLSQWGAAEMAQGSKGNEKDYYKKILGHYYTGISFKEMY